MGTASTIAKLIVLWFFALIVVGGVSATNGLAGFVVFVFFILLTILWVTSRGPKCPNCGKRRTIYFDHSLVVNTTRGFGLVTRIDRTEIESGNKTLAGKTRRQERVPTITDTIRSFFKCRKCDYSFYTDNAVVREDFSRSGYESPNIIHAQEKVIEREVIKVPCRYCKTLNDPIRNKKCPNCGAPIAM